jgi:hypothetical protein
MLLIRKNSQIALYLYLLSELLFRRPQTPSESPKSGAELSANACMCTFNSRAVQVASWQRLQWFVPAGTKTTGQVNRNSVVINALNILRQVRLHVPPLVHLAALHFARPAKRTLDPRAQGLGSVDHEQVTPAVRSPRSTRSSSRDFTTLMFSVAPCHSPSTCFFPLKSMPSTTTTVWPPTSLPSIRRATYSRSSSLLSQSSFSCLVLA